MNMVVHAADHQGLEIILSGDAAQVGPKTLFHVGFNPGFAILGTENNVEEERCQGVCHG